MLRQKIFELGRLEVRQNIGAQLNTPISHGSDVVDRLPLLVAPCNGCIGKLDVALVWRGK